MIILVGPSAVGKSEVAKELYQKNNIKKIITYTTRNMRDGEINDVDYHFINKEDFITKINQNFFIETAYYNQNYYGTAFNDISRDKVLIVEPNGANIYYEKLKDKVFIVYLLASESERKIRMELRGDSPESIKERLKSDNDYFNFKNFSHIDLIINTENKTISEIAEEIISKY